MIIIIIIIIFFFFGGQSIYKKTLHTCLNKKK